MLKLPLFFHFHRCFRTYPFNQPLCFLSNGRCGGTWISYSANKWSIVSQRMNDFDLPSEAKDLELVRQTYPNLGFLTLDGWSGF